MDEVDKDGGAEANSNYDYLEVRIYEILLDKVL
jgi:hypothetical protein